MKDGFLKFKISPNGKNAHMRHGIQYLPTFWNPDFAAPVGISTEALLQAAASGSAVAALPVASWLSKVNFESSSDSKKEGSLSHGSWRGTTPQTLTPLLRGYIYLYILIICY